MRFGSIVAVIAAAAAVPEIGYFRFERPIVNAPATGQTCVVLDPQIFSHAGPGLADLRLYRDGSETPYAIHRAVPVAAAAKPIAVLNLGRRGAQTVFDAPMPEGKFADVELNLDAQNFIATAVVSGSQDEGASDATRLGSYTIFDLTSQRLGRSTILHLPESDFRYLHFAIAGPLKPDSMNGLTVERVADGKPKYVTVAESNHEVQQGRSSIFEFNVPAHVPVDRIVFAPGAEPVNFSRDVSVTISPVVQHAASDSEPSAPVPSGYGNLLRVHSVQDGHHIEEEHLAIDAPGTELDSSAAWKVSIDNGDDPPIELQSVSLRMVERDLCFDAVAGQGYALYYGDAALNPPRYDYARLFVYQGSSAAVASLGAEVSNAAFRPRPDQRPFTERHPVLLWIALLVVIVVLGIVALRSMRQTSRAQ
jgi:hypothetical protein